MNDNPLIALFGYFALLSLFAVGGANAANPIPIIIPCHRVIGSNGALTGFGGGIDVKRRLLDFEAGYSTLL